MCVCLLSHSCIYSSFFNEVTFSLSRKRDTNEREREEGMHVFGKQALKAVLSFVDIFLIVELCFSGGLLVESGKKLCEWIQ